MSDGGDENLSAIAECIVQREEERPGFWADLLVEVPRLQAGRRRGRMEDPPTLRRGHPRTRLRAPVRFETPGKDSPKPEGRPEQQSLVTPEETHPLTSTEPSPQTPERPASTEFTGAPREHWLEDLQRQEPEPLEEIPRVPPKLVAPELRRPRPFPDGIMGRTEGCWLCRSPDHFRRECPRSNEPQVVQICYRCGRLGTTVRNCPECREGWLAQGPYVPGRGHVGPDPPRRRGPPLPMRRREHGWRRAP